MSSHELNVFRRRLGMPVKAFAHMAGVSEGALVKSASSGRITNHAKRVIAYLRTLALEDQEWRDLGRELSNAYTTRGALYALYLLLDEQWGDE